MSKPWTELTKDERKVHILRLLNATDVSDHDKRMQTVRCLLYLCQGCFGECQNAEEQVNWTRENIYLLYECGTFSTFCELLSMEIE